MGRSQFLRCLLIDGGGGGWRKDAKEAPRKVVGKLLLELEAMVFDFRNDWFAPVLCNAIRWMFANIKNYKS